VVSRPATPFDSPASARISPIKGATEVSAGRKLADTNTMLKASNTTRKRPRWTFRAGVAGAFFLMRTLYTYLRKQSR
jgi:uncharacterized membrane protein YdcZ (DUF606 family)